MVSRKFAQNRQLMTTQAPSLNTFNPESKGVKRMLATMPTWKMKLFMLAKLPGAWFMGVRIDHITPQDCKVSLPMGWRSQNPFKSIYFAAQAAAAELSTGALALVATQDRGPISMLVADMQATFIKKATTRTTFHCTEGDKILDAIQAAIDTGEGQTVTVKTQGVQKTGEIVSEFSFTWSFKVKSKRKK